MNIQYLKYAIAVADSGSISKAAEKLYIAQPNVSRAIKELEKELNIDIFDRTAKGMVLTPSGQRLVQYGREILKNISEVEEMFTQGTTPKKRFSIAVPRAAYISYAFIDFTKFLSSADHCEVLYREASTTRTIEGVRQHDFNLGIVRYPVEHDRYYKQLLAEKGLEGVLVAEVSYVLLMSQNSPLAKVVEPTFQDLSNYIEVAHGDSAVSLPVKKEGLPDNVSCKITLFDRSCQYQLLSQNAETFMWVSPIPQEALQKYNLVQVNCADNTKRYKDILIYRKDYTLNSLENTFITCLTQSKRKHIG